MRLIRIVAGQRANNILKRCRHAAPIIISDFKNLGHQRVSYFEKFASFWMMNRCVSRELLLHLLYEYWCMMIVVCELRSLLSQAFRTFTMEEYLDLFLNIAIPISWLSFQGTLLWTPKKGRRGGYCVVTRPPIPPRIENKWVSVYACM